MASDVTKFGAGVGPEGVRRHPWRNFLNNLNASNADAFGLNVTGQPAVSSGRNYLQSGDPAQLFGARLLDQDAHQAQAQPWREIADDSAQAVPTTLPPATTTPHPTTTRPPTTTLPPTTTTRMPTTTTRAPTTTPKPTTRPPTTTLRPTTRPPTTTRAPTTRPVTTTPAPP